MCSSLCFESFHAWSAAGCIMRSQSLARLHLQRCNANDMDVCSSSSPGVLRVQVFFEVFSRFQKFNRNPRGPPRKSVRYMVYKTILNRSPFPRISRFLNFFFPNDNNVATRREIAAAAAAPPFLHHMFSAVNATSFCILADHHLLRELRGFSCI